MAYQGNPEIDRLINPEIDRLMEEYKKLQNSHQQNYMNYSSTGKKAATKTYVNSSQITGIGVSNGTNVGRITTNPFAPGSPNTTGLSMPGPANSAGHGFKTNKDDGKVDWAKFAMWLRGFLAAVEGQPLTPETVSKIMEKLATVDPDRPLSYGPGDFDFMKQLQQYPPYIPPPRTVPFPPTGTVTWKGTPVNQLSFQQQAEYLNAINNANIYSAANITIDPNAVATLATV